MSTPRDPGGISSILKMNVKAGLLSMAASWKSVKQTPVAGFIFKRQSLDSHEGGAGFQDLALQPVYIR